MSVGHRVGGTARRAVCGGKGAWPWRPAARESFLQHRTQSSPHPTRLGTTQHSTAQHSTAQHSTAQHSTAQHSTAQHSTAQHSTAQHSTAQHSTAHRRARPGIASPTFFTTSSLTKPPCREREARAPAWGRGGGRLTATSQHLAAGREPLCHSLFGRVSPWRPAQSYQFHAESKRASHASTQRRCCATAGRRAGTGEGTGGERQTSWAQADAVGRQARCALLATLAVPIRGVSEGWRALQAPAKTPQSAPSAHAPVALSASNTSSKERRMVAFERRYCSMAQGEGRRRADSGRGALSGSLTGADRALRARLKGGATAPEAAPCLTLACLDCPLFTPPCVTAHCMSKHRRAAPLATSHMGQQRPSLPYSWPTPSASPTHCGYLHARVLHARLEGPV